MDLLDPDDRSRARRHRGGLPVRVSGLTIDGPQDPLVRDLSFEAPAGEEVPAAEGQGEEDAAMEALIAEKAAGNHTLNFILSQDFTREEWEETLDRMIGYGAQISEEEKQQIIDWLVARND